MKTLLLTLLATITIGLLAIAGPATAKTPDGKTPAEETWCDELKDGTPGLYGLCVAYCEAHDADYVYPDGSTKRLNTPNRRILTNYDKKRKKDDPAMPCLLDQQGEEEEEDGEQPVQACPCWTATQLDGLMPPQQSYNVNNPPACWNDSLTMIENFELGADEPGFQLWASTIQFEEGCVVVNNGYSTEISSGENFNLTPEQGASCAALLTEHAREHSSDSVWNCFD